MPIASHLGIRRFTVDYLRQLTYSALGFRVQEFPKSELPGRCVGDMKSFQKSYVRSRGWRIYGLRLNCFGLSEALLNEILN